MSAKHYTKPTNPRFIDLTGQTFGRLTVISYQLTDCYHYALWLCRCSCGSDCTIKGTSLRFGRTQSCGCLHKERLIARCTTHGDTHSRLYNTYNNILKRCYNKNEVSYKDYGERGIGVCEEWRSSYETFRDWAHSNGYRDDLTIERKDVNRGYEPENCTWIPKSQQNLNRTDSRIMTAFGESKPLVLWASDPRCRVKYRTLRSRLDDGWEFEKALTTGRLRPPRGGTAGYDPE